MIWRRRIPKTRAEWVTDRFGWLIRTIGPRQFFHDTRLVLPTRAFFETPEGDGDQTAQALFREVKAHMGLSDWPCRLVQRGTLDASARTEVAGSFYKARGEIEAVITYNPALLKERCAFLGTLAHELSHFVLERQVEPIPGGEPEVEALTDLAVIVAGFGLVDLEGAHRIGWTGYLNRDERCYALATFLRLKDLPLEAALPHLSPDPARRLRRAMAHRDAESDELTILEALRGP